MQSLFEMWTMFATYIFVFKHPTTAQLFPFQVIGITEVKLCVMHGLLPLVVVLVFQKKSQVRQPAPKLLKRTFNSQEKRVTSLGTRLLVSFTSNMLRFELRGADTSSKE